MSALAASECAPGATQCAQGARVARHGSGPRGRGSGSKQNPQHFPYLSRPIVKIIKVVNIIHSRGWAFRSLPVKRQPMLPMSELPRQGTDYPNTMQTEDERVTCPEELWHEPPSDPCVASSAVKRGRIEISPDPPDSASAGAHPVAEQADAGEHRAEKHTYPVRSLRPDAPPFIPCVRRSNYKPHHRDQPPPPWAKALEAIRARSLQTGKSSQSDSSHASCDDRDVELYADDDDYDLDSHDDLYEDFPDDDEIEHNNADGYVHTEGAL